MLIPAVLGPPSIDPQQVEAKTVPSKPKEPAVVKPSQPEKIPEQPIITAEATNKTDWMTSAGIPESDWPHVEVILGNESKWKLDEVNYQGCIGLGQSCPDGNKGEMLARCPDWATNGMCQMQVWNDYAMRRYGSWSYAEEWKFCKYICYNAYTGITTDKKGEPWW